MVINNPETSGFASQLASLPMATAPQDECGVIRRRLAELSAEVHGKELDGSLSTDAAREEQLRREIIDLERELLHLLRNAVRVRPV